MFELTFFFLFFFFSCQLDGLKRQSTLTYGENVEMPRPILPKQCKGSAELESFLKNEETRNWMRLDPIVCLFFSFLELSLFNSVLISPGNGSTSHCDRVFHVRKDPSEGMHWSGVGWEEEAHHVTKHLQLHCLHKSGFPLSCSFIAS